MTDIKSQLDDLSGRLEKIKVKLDPDQRARQIAELEA